MKKLKWIKPGVMKISSGVSAFDRKCAYIGIGNYISQTQDSNRIRSYDSIGKAFPVGFLRACDIRNCGQLPEQILDLLGKYKHKELILYHFFHYYKTNHDELRKVDHGYILTNLNHRLLSVYQVGLRDSSRMVLKECAKYITIEEKIT